MKYISLLFSLFLVILGVSCGGSPSSSKSSSGPSYPGPIGPIFGTNLSSVIQTSIAGDKLTPKAGISFVTGTASGVIVDVNTGNVRQKLEGIGSSLTESSAYVLANLPVAVKNDILNNLFTPVGANLDMSRVHIGACDFCVNGAYSYDDTNNDTNLAFFSIAPDKAGFAGVDNPSYDLLPLIKDVVAIKPTLKIVATPWTSPKWMKAPANWNSGTLKASMYTSYANYFVKYIQAYSNEGVNIWAITPMNEPYTGGGGGGQWEGMYLDPTNMRTFVTNALGPAISANCSNVKIFDWDYSRDPAMMNYVTNLFDDAGTESYFEGTAVHWYTSSTNVHQDSLDALHNAYPTKSILHTEGCIDSISKGQTALAWWQKDIWWWSPLAENGFYGTPYGEGSAANPAYVPVHRYARDIIEGLNNWLIGWIDWNCVLDKSGGPNHANNNCGAPVMVDTLSKTVYYTPVFYVLSHFGRYIRPGDHVVEVTTTTPAMFWDDFHATATLSSDGQTVTVFALNTTASPINYNIQIGSKYAPVTIDSNAIQTIQIKLSTL